MNNINRKSSLVFDWKDIRIDTASGSAAVNIVHVPTGQTTFCNLFSTPEFNKHFALGVLNERLRNIT